MKPLLCIFIALFYAREAICDVVTVIGENPEEFLKKISEYRPKLGKAANVEMKQLKYSDRMKAVIDGLSGDCNTWNHGKDYRVAPMFYDAFGGMLLQVELALITDPTLGGKIDPSKAPKELTAAHLIDEGTLSVVELFIPEQTEAACAKKECTGKLPKDVVDALKTSGILSEEYKFKEVCVVGPQRRISESLVKSLNDAEAKLKAEGSNGAGSQGSGGTKGAASQGTGIFFFMILPIVFGKYL